MVTAKKVVKALEQTWKCNIVDGLSTTPSRRIVGYIASDRFAGKDHPQRQRLLWKALEKCFGQSDLDHIGPIVTMTEEEALTRQAHLD